MKNKKFTVPAIILAVAVFAVVVCSIISSLAFKPVVTEAEFPFSITYELDGEKVTINDVYKARYVDNGGYADTKGRNYSGEGGGVYTLKKENNTRIELWTKFYADYLMGDPAYDYFDDEPFEPIIYYYDSQEQEYSDEETLSEHGVKLISFEYPTPIENSLVFSHFSYFSSTIVLLTMLIAILALLAIIIFVRKEKELKYRAIDIISIVLNFVIGFAIIPFITIIALLIDVEGGGPELYFQLLYFIPVLSVLSIATSIALRRKGHGVMSLIFEFIGPVAFVLYLIIFYGAFSAF